MNSQRHLSRDSKRDVRKAWRAGVLVVAIVAALPLSPASANRPLSEHGAHEVPEWVKQRVDLQLGDGSHHREGESHQARLGRDS
jgi:hypothetical protein